MVARADTHANPAHASEADQLFGSRLVRRFVRKGAASSDSKHGACDEEANGS
jgi:hypothetical protein